MLESVLPREVRVGQHDYIPPFLAPLIAAAGRGEALLPYVQAITNNLGFDSFLYAMTAMPKPDHEHVAYVFTTQPPEWVTRYDQNAYVEVDPRVILNWNSAIPLIWDQATVRGKNKRQDEFLDDALRHGIASGVSFMFHGPHNAHVLVALNSRIAINDPIRLQAIARNVSDIMMFGHYFHEIFMRPTVPEGLKLLSVSIPLSKRERECLHWAARGFTTSDIAVKLEIRSRTVQFHFDSLRSKLGAANRQEAIAIAAQRNEL